MLDMALVFMSCAILAAGAFFVVVGAVGVYRFPDFYSRLHGAGITDTMGAELILLGLVLQAGFTLIAVKLVFIGLFLFITSPTATHAIANAALTAGLRPYLSVKSGAVSDGPGPSDQE